MIYPIHQLRKLNGGVTVSVYQERHEQHTMRSLRLETMGLDPQFKSTSTAPSFKTKLSSTSHPNASVRTGDFFGLRITINCPHNRYPFDWRSYLFPSVSRASYKYLPPNIESGVSGMASQRLGYTPLNGLRIPFYVLLNGCIVIFVFASTPLPRTYHFHLNLGTDFRLVG